MSQQTSTRKCSLHGPHQTIDLRTVTKVASKETNQPPFRPAPASSRWRAGIHDHLIVKFRTPWPWVPDLALIMVRRAAVLRGSALRASHLRMTATPRTTRSPGTTSSCSLSAVERERGEGLLHRHELQAIDVDVARQRARPEHRLGHLLGRHRLNPAERSGRLLRIPL